MLLVVLIVFIIFRMDCSVANEENVLDISKNILELQSNDIHKKLPILDLINKNNKVIVVTASTVQDNPMILVQSPVISSRSLYFVDTAVYLNSMPGFSFIRNGGINNDPVFRGMLGSQIRILMDNGEMTSACSSRMDPPSSYISSETFDILNIIKGPQTVLLGTVAPGGILQFQRYHPYFDKSKIQLRSNLTIGSNNTINKNVDSIIGNDRGYIRLIGHSSNANDYRDGYNNLVHSAWCKWNADAILSYNYDSNTYIEINLGQGNGSARYSTKVMDGLCFARESYGLKIETVDVNSTLNKIELQTWCNNIHHIMIDKRTLNTRRSILYPKNCCSLSQIDNKMNYMDQFSWGFRSITTGILENIRCDGGIDFQISQHQKNISQKNNCYKDNIIKNSGVFIEFVYDFISNIKIVGGTRLEYYHTVNMINDHHKYAYHKIYPVGFIRYENNIYPSFLYYAGLGTSRRFPDYWEFMANELNNTKKIGNLSLIRPEKTIQADVGISFQKSQIDGWISAYAGYVKDFILYENESHNFHNIDNNIIHNHFSNIQAKMFGSEMKLRYKFNDCWYLEDNISWSWSMNVDTKCILNTISPLENVFIGKFKGNNYDIGMSWRLVSSLPYHHGWLFLNKTNYYSSNILLKKNIVKPGFGTVSVYALWNISKYYTCSIGINNILNKAYIENIKNIIEYHDSQTNSSMKQPIYEPGRTWWIRAEIKL